VDDAVLPATTHWKAGLGGEGQSHHEREPTHLADSGVYAWDLVPNPMASGLISYLNLIHLYMQSRNQLCLPPMSLERTLQVFFGEDRKSRSRDCFSVLASSSIHRFDLAFAYDVISILLVVFVFK
jgi:hypothetical protein